MEPENEYFNEINIANNENHGGVSDNAKEGSDDDSALNSNDEEIDIHDGEIPEEGKMNYNPQYYKI